MTEMVERVARAMSIKDKVGDYWNEMAEDGDGHGYVGKNEYRVMARAAIEAMREPTKQMIDAATDQEFYETTWKEMIDAALATGTPA